MCPIDNIPVKWFDNRYLTYASLSAKARCSKVTEKRMNTYLAKTGYSSWNSKDNIASYERYVATSMRNWGVDNPCKSKVVIQKMKAARTENGSYHSPETKSEIESYYSDVWFHTQCAWRDFHDKINPLNLPRGRGKGFYQLDHVFSISEAYKLNVLPEIVAHWTNLQMLPHELNASKYTRCDKTIMQLYEDYYINT